MTSEPATQPHLLDQSVREEHKAQNQMRTVILIIGMAVLAGFAAFLIWGAMGLVVAAVSVAISLFFAPSVPPEFVMRLYRAKPIDERHGRQLQRILDVLAERAELDHAPKLYLIPSMALNAFATGRPDRSAIAMTEGLLRKLSLREVTAVLAHEVSHVRNDDLKVMGIADALSRLTRIMFYLALAGLVLNLPAIFGGRVQVPWIALVLLYLAPTIGSLLQLGLSRTREYDADLEGAMLTGDPEGLALALKKIENDQGRMWHDLTPGGRKVVHPSILRSHPLTEDRIARLKALGGAIATPQITIQEEPMVSLVGFGPGDMRPRYRFPGLWY